MIIKNYHKSLINIIKHSKSIVLCTFLGIILAQIYIQIKPLVYKANSVIYVGNLSYNKDLQKVPTVDPYLFSIQLSKNNLFPEDILKSCQINSQLNGLNKINFNKTSTPLFLEIQVEMDSHIGAKNCINLLGEHITDKLKKLHEQYKENLITKRNILEDQIFKLQSFQNESNNSFLFHNMNELNRKYLEREDLNINIHDISNNKPQFFKVNDADVKKHGPSNSYTLILGAILGLLIGIGFSYLRHQLNT